MDATMPFLSDQEHEYVQACIKERRFDEVTDYINQLLFNDPNNQELLLVLAEIHYRSGKLDKSSKTIDFLNYQSGYQDPLHLYVKGVVEMDQNKWKSSRDSFIKALSHSTDPNPELMRNYAWSEYRYGNREKGLHHMETIVEEHKFDSDFLYNLIQMYMLEKKYQKAQALVDYFDKNRSMYEKPHEDTLAFFDRLRPCLSKMLQIQKSKFRRNKLASS